MKNKPNILLEDLVKIVEQLEKEWKDDLNKGKWEKSKGNITINGIELPKGIIRYNTQGLLSGDTELEFIKINDLRNYETSCGASSSKPFTNKVINYLKEHSQLDFVIAEVCIEDNSIWNMSVKWKRYPHFKWQKISEDFASTICANGGSLREELCREDNWDCYESE